MKKVIILQHDGGELANQLWNFTSIYAYCVEKGYKCENWSFFEYAGYFSFSVKNFLINNIFFLPFSRHNKRRSSVKTIFFRKLYKILVFLPVVFFLKRQIFFSNESQGGIFYLPPSGFFSERLKKLENTRKNIFFANVSGGVFRNTEGLNKHRKSVVEHFKPNRDVGEKISIFIDRLRNKYKIIVGVHFRQGDYSVFKNGKYSVSERRICEIIDEYINFFKIKKEDICFIIASDGPVNEDSFRNLPVVISKQNAIEDLFILSNCDAIIGSDSTFGHFAAYYGDIPHIVMKNEPIDWIYYKDKTSYFINKYFTVMLV